jgi:hypothetical protein
MKKIAAIIIAIVTTASAPLAASAEAPADKGRAVLDITPSTVHFGEQPVGTTSIATLTITNTSDATVHLCCFELSFNFRRGETGNMGIQPDPCGTALPEGIPLGPGESCTISILFQPIAEGRVAYDFCVGYVESGYRTDPRSCITLTGIGV